MTDKTAILAEDFPTAGQEPVATVFTMEALAPGGGVKYHATIHKPVPAGTKLYAAPQPATFDPADMATASAQGFRDGESAERARCAQAVRTTLANWRCVPSQHLREFVDLAVAAIEGGKE